MFDMNTVVMQSQNDAQLICGNRLSSQCNLYLTTSQVQGSILTKVSKAWSCKCNQQRVVD